MKFLKYFISKVKTLGYKIYCTNEDYSSSKCVRCYTFLETIKWRCKECTGCNVKYNRDRLGGENIARIGLSMLKHGSRPHYLPIWHGRLNSTTPVSNTSTTSTIC